MRAIRGGMPSSSPPQPAMLSRRPPPRTASLRPTPPSAYMYSPQFMSLLAPRPFGNLERASVVLPTVKCSTCAQEIPLNSLGEHICPPLPELVIAPPGHDSRNNSPSPQTSPFMSSGSLKRNNAPTMLRAPGANYRPGELSRFGSEYPADVPMSAVSASSMNRWPSSNDLPPGEIIAPPSVVTMPDTRSGGNAGMAGVGRRAFAAAAAWNARGGVAMSPILDNGEEFYVSGTRHQKSPSPPNNSPPSAAAPPYIAPQSTGPNRVHRPQQPTQREPVILPKAPLAERNRGDSLRRQQAGSRAGDREGAGSRADDYRSASRAASRNDEHRSASRTDDYRSASRNDDLRSGSRAGDYRSASRNDDHRSASRNGPSRAGSRNDEYAARIEEARAASRAQLERSTSATSQQSQEGRQRFFDRYNQMMGSRGDQTHSLERSPPPYDDDDRKSVDSLDDSSSLPWAQPSPDIHTKGFDRFEHHRYPTEGSINSNGSSSYPPSGDNHGSSYETELVMTPSQSWEGLSSVDAPVGKGQVDGLGFMSDNSPGSLAQIGEEEEEDDGEGERLVFGAPNPMRRSRDDAKMPRSSSEATLTPTGHGASPPAYRHDLDLPRVGSPADGRSSPRSFGTLPASRPKRVCARCGDAVGGSRRYVERDGVVLCEADWKKMYLPACRRCKQPIEKSAVSSSDGQLKGKWHRACFTCTECDSPFEGDDFYVHDGRPWCQYHYAEVNGTLCAASHCRKPIEGPCILAPNPNGDLRFHPGHLRCDHRGGVSGAQSCREDMNDYYDVAGERFCERHVGEAVRRLASTTGGGTRRAEKRRTKLIDLANGAVLQRPQQGSPERGPRSPEQERLEWVR